MISGLSTPSIATAIRTASQARSTMDTMSRQIATGQRVSSVRDDGAAWTRAAALRSSSVERAVNEDRLALYAANSQAYEAWEVTERQYVELARDIYLQAVQHPPGTAARASLKAEIDQLVAGLSGDLNSNNTAPLQAHTNLDSSHGLLTGLYAVTKSLGAVYNLRIQPALAAAPLDTASSAAVQAQIAFFDTQLATLRSFEQGGGQLSNRIETSRRINQSLARVTEQAAGALVDADLGKASAARATAEARQQLALSTVRQAISAYGNFAGGLLGNVQRTQRGIMA